MILGLVFHIIFTVLGLLYISSIQRRHSAALVALAHALRLLAERTVEAQRARARQDREDKWN